MTIEISDEAMEFAEGWEAYEADTALNVEWTSDKIEGWKAAQNAKWAPVEQESGLTEDTHVVFLDDKGKPKK